MPTRLETRRLKGHVPTTANQEKRPRVSSLWYPAVVAFSRRVSCFVFRVSCSFPAQNTSSQFDLQKAALEPFFPGTVGLREGRAGEQFFGWNY